MQTSFTRKDNLVRHHRDTQNDEVSLSSRLRSLGYSSNSASYETTKKWARIDDSEISEENETNDESEVDEKSDTDDESVDPASRSDEESDRGDVEDIEKQLKDENVSTHPFTRCETYGISLKKTQKTATMATS